MNTSTTVLMTGFITHDVKRFILSKPDGFNCKPGQGIEIAVDKAEWKSEGRPFTPTSLKDDLVIELMIKRYPGVGSVTEELHKVKAGDKLLISDVFGSITYNGPGVFIAGGAGVTPFIAILRDLAHNGKLDDHSLIFSNKTPADIICEKELKHYLGKRCIFTCTRSSGTGYESRRVTKDFLKEKIDDFSRHFYVCGPETFVKNINTALEELGARSDSLVFER